MKKSTKQKLKKVIERIVEQKLNENIMEPDEVIDFLESLMRDLERKVEWPTGDFLDKEEHTAVRNNLSEIYSLVESCINIISEKSLNESKGKIKYHKKLTKKEWSNISKHNKHIGQDGIYYITKLDPKYGTILAPVEIVKETLNS